MQSLGKTGRTNSAGIFNDQYDYVADKVRGVAPEILYEILYSEVAPVCFTNLVAAVPPVWIWFDPDRLRQSIGMSKSDDLVAESTGVFTALSIARLWQKNC
ncbi:DUF7079 family protein [Pseudomonas sp. RIT288]|uniref:DUF7079 family protein n=1 Tax=Pseudomonas sp. RIT288 TaxID=1470589 RepID=UPI001F4224D4|nr:hypothetical protein [Pseudomonas sp. RIT288]